MIVRRSGTVFPERVDCAAGLGCEYWLCDERNSVTLNKNDSAPKELQSIQRGIGSHWVGDGFPVRTLLAYPNLGPAITPFLLLDFAGPHEFPPTRERLGVGQHPHRGFETVTFVYDGEVEHKDSAGGGGRIGPGDVQWMTAGSGIVHEEFHGRDFAARGGMFQMIQLWVNLPAEHKMTSPRYQGITAERIPTVELPEHSGTARIIAGELGEARGPAETVTPIHMWDLALVGGKRTELAVPDGYTAAVVVLNGELRVNGSDPIRDAEVGLLARAGSDFVLECTTDTRALLLAGEPIDEPIVGQGPFVMNTRDEIRQAMHDYSTGKMGRLP